MATLTSRPPDTAFPLRPELREPLNQLRRAVRSYILLEGVAFALIWAGVWCWLTFLIDYGLFRLLDLDYIRDGSHTVRWAWRTCFLPLLVAGMAYVIGYLMAYRLSGTLREPDLALVLERTFPRELSDRLVTAVELADPEQARAYGYSWPMVEATQAEAVRALSKLNPGKALKWGRVYKLGAAAGALAMSLLALGLFATDCFATWLQRDVQLANRYWPRPVILMLDPAPKAVPFGGEARIQAQVWKYVVASRDSSEGWRPLTVGDLLSDSPSKPWELHGLVVHPSLVQALPPAWRDLPVDQIEVRVKAAGTPTPEGKALREEMGLAVIQRVRSLLKTARYGQSPLDAETQKLVPVGWQHLSPEVLDDHLAAAQRLTDAETDRLLAALASQDAGAADGALRLAAALGPVAGPGLTLTAVRQGYAALLTPFELTRRFDTPAATHDLEAAQAVGNVLAPIPAPVLSAPFLRRLAGDRTLQAGDWARLLPNSWQALPARKVEERLRDYRLAQTPERIGQELRLQLLTLLDGLDQKVARAAAKRPVAKRRTFRVLTVPDEVTVEFEQILTEEERQRGKGKVAQPKVRRTSDANTFVYEFKKIERPLRFRVRAGSAVTAWNEINVKPLPTLKTLTRTHDEPGYLHGSNARVQVGPLPISLEGAESRCEVPAGAAVRLEAECYKPLQAVNAVVEEPRGVAMVEGAKWDEANGHFTVQLRPVAPGEYRLRLDFQDADGINGSRPLIVTVVPDHEPEFPLVRFDAVNRKMITAKAIIPFSGQIRDDHGLLAAWFDVTVERMDRKPFRQVRLPLLRFAPLRPPAAAGLRFERREDVTPPRILGGPAGDLWAAGLILGRLPAGGWVSCLQVPAADVPREHVFEFRERPGSAPVLGPEDEYLDTLRLQPLTVAGPDGKPAPLPVPYRVLIRLGARDNLVLTDTKGEPLPAGQEARNAETFEFNVVAEEDLLIEAGKREEDLRDRCDDVVTQLRKARTVLARLRDDFPSLKDENEFRRAVADGQDTAKLLRDAREGLDQKVVREFRQIYRELVLNRCREDVLNRIDRKICAPLEEVLMPGRHFERVDQAVDALTRGIEMDRAKVSRELFETAIDQDDRLIARMEEILGEMKKLIEFNQALQALRDLIRTETEIMDRIREQYRKEKGKELEGDKP